MHRTNPDRRYRRRRCVVGGYVKPFRPAGIGGVLRFINFMSKELFIFAGIKSERESECGQANGENH